jgi:hypothetical protein
LRSWLLWLLLLSLKQALKLILVAIVADDYSKRLRGPRETPNLTFKGRIRPQKANLL